MSAEPARGLAREKAYRFAKDRILDGTFGSGELLSESAIAVAADVSRTPVRDAFLQLEGEGLVRLYPKRGAVVVPVSHREVREVLQVRELLEGFAADGLWTRDGDTREVLVRDLEDLLVPQEEAVRRGDDAAFARADRAFHERFVAAAGNTLVDGYYRGLRDRQVRMNVAVFRRDPRRAQRNHDEHTAIVRALAEGRADDLAVLLRQHVHGVGRLLTLDEGDLTGLIP